MFQPIIAGTGLAGLNILKSTLDTQMERMVASRLHSAEEDYFKENIKNISSAEELVQDRRLLGVVLSRFGLQDDADKPAFIQRVLEEGTNSPAAMANRLPDRRYRQLTNALGFGPQSISPFDLQKQEYGNFKSYVTSVLRDNRYWSTPALQEDEVTRVAEPLRKLLSVVDRGRQSLDRELENLSQFGLDRLSNRSLYNTEVQSVEDQLRYDVLKHDDLRAFLGSVVDLKGQFSRYGEKLGGEYDIIQPKRFDELSAEAQAQARATWAEAGDIYFNATGTLADAGVDGFEGPNASEDPLEAQAAQDILGADVNTNTVLRFKYSQLSPEAQAAADATMANASFTEDGQLIDLAPPEDVATFEYEDLNPLVQEEALIGALTTFFEPNSFSFLKLGQDRYLEKLVEAHVANSPVEKTGSVSRDDLASSRFDAFVDDILQGFRRQEFELAVGNQSDTLRIALFAERQLPEIAELDTSENGKWFSILGNPPLRKVFETVLGLPSQFGSIDIDEQLERLKERASDRLGVDDPSDLGNEETVEKVIRQYVALANLQSGGGLSSGVGGSAALTLLQTGFAGGGLLAASAYGQ